MDNIYAYLVKMPPGVREFVTPCSDGYTVYVDKNLTQEKQCEAYAHALRHIEGGDFYKEGADVQEIEWERRSAAEGGTTDAL